jgi:N-acetylneuraminate synthase/N,N'-diacetyllegionaminate synthase
VVVSGAVLFLITARGGSKGIPGKNLRPVGGIPLVGRAARTARQAVPSLSGRGHRVVCSTDSPEIAAVAQAWGAQVPFLRPAELASDAADSADVALHALDWFAARGERFAALALLQPTTPLTIPDDLVGAVRLFREGAGAPVATVSPAHHPYWTYHVEGGRLRAAVPSDREVLRRQDVAACVALNGAAFVVDPEAFRRTRRFVEPEGTLAFVMPSERGIDIDDEADLRHCEAVLAGRAVPAVPVGSRVIGPAAPCFVIAEAGVNHNGDVDLAHRLVDAAAESRADAVKFQTFRPDALAAAGAPLAEYQERSIAASDQQRMLEKLALSEDAHRELKRHAEERGLVFLSSPFDERSADFLDDLGVAAFKVPSGEVTNHPFLAHVAAKGRPMLVSTGMCDLSDVASAVDAIRAAGGPPLALLHCVSSYPAAAADANVRAMQTLGRAFGVPVGWSDHTEGLESTLAAVALGACVIERHLTLDQSLPGPDHRASLEPGPFARMVAAVRTLESSLGSGEKVPRAAERPIAAVVRKSLHWSVALPAGARVESGHLLALRPGTGLPPSERAAVIGRQLRRAVRAGAMVSGDDLEGAP